MRWDKVRGLWVPRGSLAPISTQEARPASLPLHEESTPFLTTNEARKEEQLTLKAKARRSSFAAGRQERLATKPRQARRTSRTATPSREVRALTDSTLRTRPKRGSSSYLRKRKPNANEISSPVPSKRLFRQTARTAKKRPDPEDSDSDESDGWYNDLCQVCDKVSPLLSRCSAAHLTAFLFVHSACVHSATSAYSHASSLLCSVIKGRAFNLL